MEHHTLGPVQFYSLGERKPQETLHLLITLTSKYDYPPGLVIHASQQEDRQKPVAKIVYSKDSVEPILGPLLLATVLEGGVENEGTDGRDLASGDPSLWSECKFQNQGKRWPMSVSGTSIRWQSVANSR